MRDFSVRQRPLLVGAARGAGAKWRASKIVRGYGTPLRGQISSSKHVRDMQVIKGVGVG